MHKVLPADHSTIGLLINRIVLGLKFVVGRKNGWSSYFTGVDVTFPTLADEVVRLQLVSIKTSILPWIWELELAFKQRFSSLLLTGTKGFIQVETNFLQVFCVLDLACPSRWT